MDAGYRIAVSEKMTFSIELLNILNTLYFAEPGYPSPESGYPMPPFSFELGTQLHL